MSKIKNVSIIGVGLIGGSLGLALKKGRAVKKVTGIGRHLEKLKKARQMGAVDEYTTDFLSGVKDADLVVICTPVGLIASTLKKILPALKDGCLITDVGSVKGPVVAAAKKVIGSRKVFFIGGHPMAGSEQAGIGSASRQLFVDAVWLLTPAKNTPEEKVAALTALLRRTGASILQLNAQSHDRIVSVTSHLPHLLAATMVNYLQLQDRKNPNTSRLTAGGFRDLTRIASSSPEIWADISLMNREEIIRAMAEFNRLAGQMLQALKSGKRKEVFNLFTRAKQTRDRMLK